MEYREISPAGEYAVQLMALSENWEKEGVTRGLVANTAEDLAGLRIFAALDDGAIVGYLSGRHALTKEPYSFERRAGAPFFEIEELYVRPELRSRGIGRSLYALAENTAKAEGAEYIFLSTATFDYKRVLCFYIEEVGMEFFYARLFKKI